MATASYTLQDRHNDVAEGSTIAIRDNEISSLDNSFQDPIYSATKEVDRSCSDEHTELDALEKYFYHSHELSDMFARSVAQLSTIEEVSSLRQRVSLLSTNTTDDDIDELNAEELLNERALIFKSISITNTSRSSLARSPCNIMQIRPSCHLEKIEQSILMKENLKYRKFLYTLKFNIINLFSAYTTCGLWNLLKFLQDDEEEIEWTKLFTTTPIETAIRNIQMLFLTLDLAIFVRLVECFEPPTAKYDRTHGNDILR
ncbi:hypothetical protein CHS0354_033666 [Potamilus streckersoni]|uniref:Uncharacterized protein n=1 Tax=Potamilus streckersoni TaxID=2493646 RepID=A0AAE0VP56_9BIVA|nr:hypothetical protein CHS0354_033666 [Potamilus streckersoni]